MAQTPSSSTSRVPGTSSQRSTHSISSALAHGVGPGPGRTVSAVATRASTNGRGAAPRGTMPAATRRPWRTTWIAQPPSRCGLCRDELGAGGQHGQPLQPGAGPDERTQPVAVHGRVLVALVARQRGQPALEAVDHSTRGDRDGHAVPPRRGRRTARRSRCRRRAPRSGPSRRARRPRSASCGDMRAVHWRTGNESCKAVSARSAVFLGAERAEVGGAVVAHLAHRGQPGERLVGHLEPDRALGVARAPVVARLVLGDQPQLAHLGLESGGARDVVDPLGQRDHLGHAGAVLAGDEVVADAGAQVLGLADVEHGAALVLEQVDPGRVRAATRRGGACGAGRGRPGRRRCAARRGTARPGCRAGRAARAARRRSPRRRPARGGTGSPWYGKALPALTTCSWEPRRG